MGSTMAAREKLERGCDTPHVGKDRLLSKLIEVHGANFPICGDQTCGGCDDQHRCSSSRMGLTTRTVLDVIKNQYGGMAMIEKRAAWADMLKANVKDKRDLDNVCMLH
jgi:hypothetical protein